MKKPAEGDFVSVDSLQFTDQVALLVKVKQNSVNAKLSKICITCWQLITATETSEPSHKDHVITGSFEQMHAATKQTLQGLCQSKTRYKSGLHGQVLQLFTQSPAFSKLNA